MERTFGPGVTGDPPHCVKESPLSDYSQGMLSWIGLAIAGLSFVLSCIAVSITWRKHLDRRWLRRREVPQLLTDLELDHQVDLDRHDERMRREHHDIGNEHNARGVYYSSAREDAQRRLKVEGDRELAKLKRDHSRRRDGLTRELKRLGGPPKK